MKRRWIGWTFGSLFAVIVLVIGAVLVLVNTQAGTRWLFAIASKTTDGALQVRSTEGAIAGPITLQGLKFRDQKTGLSLAVARIDLDLAMMALFKMQVQVVDAHVSGVDLLLGTPSAEPPAEPDRPFTLEAPIDVVIDRFALRDLLVRDQAAEVIRLTSLDFVGSWVSTRVDIDTLEVKSPQGEIFFAGNVQDNETYVGTGEGRFHWTQGEQTYVGTLKALAESAAANLELRLTRPLRADLKVDLQQQKEDLPWKFELAVPSFDPRETLMPDSSLQSLAAQLRGEGTMERGVANGHVSINGEELTFERLAFDRGESTLDIDGRILAGGGTLDANAIVQSAATPVSAKVEARWGDITVPEQWAGQTLKTRGDIAFEGSANSYQARGDLSLGPPDRMSDIELRVTGSPERVELQQFDIVQKHGRLAAVGKLDLQPDLGWSIDANATSFDPGEFATAWPGDLNFKLATQGVIAQEGPQAKLKLDELRGKLRGRALSGNADVTLAANKVLSGHADLRSGKSRVQLQAAPSDVMNAVASIDVPTLDDWLPNAGGALNARFSARGNWPDTTIEGQARGESLRFNDMRAEGLQLHLNVSTPTQPSGSLNLGITDAVAAGMQIDSLRADASGSAEAHALKLEIRGSPVGTQLALEGSQIETGWRGTLSDLILDVQDAARLRLQQPVEINYTAEQSSISQACFADGEIRLCLEGAMESDGTLRAEYSLRELPFALANAFASAESPLAFDGTLQGDGRIARNTEGQFSGTATLRSERGQIGRSVPDTEQPEVLLTFNDLDITAALEADRAQTQLSARLNESGSLRGELSMSGLSEPAAELNGSIAASLPSIAVIELFAPQLANVKGAVNLRADVQGRADDPRITGELRLEDLAADVPEFGLKLTNGELTATPRVDEGFDLAGGIQSGAGSVAFAGVVRTEGTSTITINGKQFVAADMPGARVIIEPDLVLERTVDRVSLRGQVTVPEATVNLQELPRGSGGGARISPDVVIVDAKTQEQAEAEAAPIYADVTVIIGDEVELSGFGLAAQVDGQLTVRERPGEPTTGSGEVHVEGRYKAYGQDLTIQEGRLLFANTPLDNPNLSLVAVREIGEVTAGLRVSGNAKNPVLTVFSEPPMGQADALSYLVAGKPLDQIRQGDGEGDAVQTAARSLGTAAGGLLAKNVGKRLGIDEFGIKDNEMIGGSAFTVGQYLSPRLFLSYGIGLFEPGEVVTLRYKLSEAFALQAENGSDESRAGIEFRMER